MLIEDVRMCSSLRTIVNSITGDPAMQQDMLQECLVCLWRMEAQKPGRTRSWYLQNCRFHVQHWLAAGRSLDSNKRARGEARVSIDTAEGKAAVTGYDTDTDGDVFELISFNDVVATLRRHLRRHERLVLRGLAEGFMLGEVASRAGLSYPTALKYRRKIAALAVKLGIASAKRLPD
jgi:DNA-directed RNA polymerase specialized sigma24 family protein